MEENLVICRGKISTPFIDDNGNIKSHTEESRYYLKNAITRDRLSQHYYDMRDLGNDHYAVAKVKYDFQYNIVEDLPYIPYRAKISKPEMKWGVIRVNRDQFGNIIPKSETLIVPWIYYNIYANNSKTAIVSYKHLTYLDLDQSRSTYGKQLIPCILNNLEPFDEMYKGFARCSIQTVYGFLPRDCLVKESIKSSELLNKNQASNISKYLNGSNDYLLDEETIAAYFNLTGKQLTPEIGSQLCRNRIPNNQVSINK